MAQDLWVLGLRVCGLGVQDPGFTLLDCKLRPRASGEVAVKGPMHKAASCEPLHLESTP